MITTHADVVGSLLWPPWLLEAQEHLQTGQITRPAYKSIEDRAVNEAVAQQEEAGLTVLTDGEMRRLSFQSQMVQAVEVFGVAPQKPAWGTRLERSGRLLELRSGLTGFHAPLISSIANQR
jgi:5-methyltetrahydropteroyltriglutamate--homocysteine methyltransferase